MTTDAGTRTPPKADAQTETPPEQSTEPPKPIDFGLLFQDGAELPEELKPLAGVKDHLKGWLDTKLGEAVTQTQQQTAERFAEQQRRQQEQHSNQAKLQEDISWADDIEAGLFSGDAEKMAAAKAKRDSDPQRYTNAMSAKFNLSRQATRDANVNEFLESTFSDFAQSGGQELIDAMTPELLAQHGHNPLRTVAALARQAGEEAGYQRGLAEGEQRSTVQNGGGGPTAAQPPRAGAQPGSITEGVQLGRPGSTRELTARYRAKQNRN